MNKHLVLISISLLFLSMTAKASDIHLVCYDPSQIGAGYHVYLTSPEGNVQNMKGVKVYSSLNSQDKSLISSQDMAETGVEGSKSYSASDSSLVITGTGGLQNGHLQMKLKNGQQISADLLCTHPMQFITE